MRQCCAACDGCFSLLGCFSCEVLAGACGCDACCPRSLCYTASDDASRAVGDDDADALRAALQRGADANHRPQDLGGSGGTLLHAAVRGVERTAACAEALLDCGADVNAQDDKWGCTPLHEAVARGSVACVTLLLQRAADVEARDKRGSTPLFVAAASECSEVRRASLLSLLLAHGAHIDATDQDGCTALHYAALPVRVVCIPTQEVSYDLSALRWLLTHGAATDVRDKDGATPLCRAARGGKLESVSLLLEHGVDVNASDARGATPLHGAAAEGHAECVSMLLEHGAVKDAAQKDGWTPLMGAARGGHVACARVLLERGADADAVAADGVNATTVARDHAMRDLLRSYSQRRDFFLSHYQLNGGPQMAQLRAELALHHGKRAWFDKSEKPNVEGMLRGVANSDVFLLFLTRDVLKRPFCLLEIREALRLRKPIILLRETEPRLTYVQDGDARQTAASVDELKAQAPEDLLPLFDHLVIVSHRQDDYERVAMRNKLCARDTAAIVPWADMLPPKKGEGGQGREALQAE